MSKLQKIFVATPLLLATALTIYVLVCRHKFQEAKIKTEQALNDYSMLPDFQTVVSKVELGRREEKPFGGFDYTLTKGVLDIVCTNKSNIFLVMKDDDDYKFKYLTIIKGASFFSSFRMEKKIPKGEARIKKMDFVDSSYLNTMVSNPLSTQETAAIIKALEERNSEKIGIGLDNTGFRFYGNANIVDVKRLISQCSNNKNNE